MLEIIRSLFVSRHLCDTRVYSGVFQDTPVTPEFILVAPAPLLDWDWWTPPHSPPQEWYFSDFQGIPVQAERREQPRWEIPIHPPHAVIPHFPFISLDFISCYSHKTNRINNFLLKNKWRNGKEAVALWNCSRPGWARFGTNSLEGPKHSMTLLCKRKQKFGNNTLQMFLQLLEQGTLLLDYKYEQPPAPSGTAGSFWGHICQSLMSCVN